MAAVVGSEQTPEERPSSPQKRPPPTSLGSARMSPLVLPKSAPPPAPKDSHSMRDQSTGSKTEGSHPRTIATTKQPPETSPRPISPRSLASSTPYFKPASIPGKSIPRPPSPTPRTQSAGAPPLKQPLQDTRTISFGTAVTRPQGPVKTTSLIGTLRGSMDVQHNGQRSTTEDQKGDSMELYFFFFY